MKWIKNKKTTDKNELKIDKKEVLKGEMIDLSVKIKMVKRIESDYVAIYKVPSFHSQKEEFIFRNQKNNYLVFNNLKPNQDLLQLSLPPDIENGKYICKYISFISKPIGKFI
jgi:hypothetical protein